MICPKCGSQTNGPICTVCGNAALVKPKKPTALIVLCIILAVVLAACAVLFFILPSGGNDIGPAAKNYVTAAYYSGNIVNARSYPSYDDFKEDLNIAIKSCSNISGGTFDFLANAEIDLPLVRTAYAADVPAGLDTDAGSGYTGGYTSGAKENIDDFLQNIKQDADIAKEALLKLDNAVNAGTSAEDLLNALDDAKKALEKADNAKIVVGNKEVSFSGIKTIGDINTAFFGADIVIDEDVLYFGTNGAVLFYADTLSANIAVIDSESSIGAVMETDDISAQLQNGASVVITFADLDDKPEVSVFSGADKPQFTDMISKYIGDFSPNGIEITTGDESTGDETVLHEGGENLNEAFLIGKWQYYPAVINPWKTLSEDEIKEVQSDLEDKKTPGSSLTHADKVHERFMIFRPDGTGIDYWVVEDVGINQVMGFWWHIEPSKGEVVLSYKHSPTEGYETEWTDGALQDFESFQRGDYSNFHDLFNWKKYYEDLYYSDRSGKTNYCLDYKKVSDSTFFEQDNTN